MEEDARLQLLISILMYTYMYTHTNQLTGAGKVAHSVKCVLCKLEDLSLDPEHPCKKLFAMA